MLKILISYILGFISCMTVGTVLLFLITYKDGGTYQSRIQLQKQMLDEDKIFSLVNSERVQNDQSELRKNWKLCGYADLRSKEIQKDWSHNGFEKDLSQLNEDLQYRTLGENISDDKFNVEEEIITGWVNSPSHFANIVGDYTDACVQCNNNYCVQIFASF